MNLNKSQEGEQASMNPSVSKHLITEEASQGPEPTLTPHQTDQDIHRGVFMKAAAELAARRHLGLKTELNDHFNNGVDLIWRGWKVHVKPILAKQNMQLPHLQWSLERPIKADIVLLIIVDIETLEVEVAGFASAQEITTANVNERNLHPCWEIPADDLHPPAELFTLQYKNLDWDKDCMVGMLIDPEIGSCSGVVSPYYPFRTAESCGDNQDKNHFSLCTYHHKMIQSGKISNAEVTEALDDHYSY